MGDEMKVDMVNRDPNQINAHVKVAFEDVLAEPESMHSIDCVWKNSYTCFNCSKNLCYKLLSIICGLPVAICWGCNFGYIAFLHIWQFTPCLACYQINAGCFRRVYTSYMECTCGPCCETMGLLFSKIVVKNIQG